MTSRYATRHTILSAALLLSAAACADGAGPLTAPASAVPASAPAAERYIVVLHSGTSDIPGVARRLAARSGGSVGFVYEHALPGFSIRVPGAAVEALARNPEVARVVPDHEVRASEVQLSATWGLDRIDQRVLPLDNTYRYDVTGAGVTAYIFDSGIRFDHQEFGGRAVPGFDGVGDGMNGGDCDGHGTHVAGTIGGRTYGVAKQVRLVSVRVLGCNGVGYASSVYAGIDWVIQNNRGPAVANFSIGGARDETYNQVMRKLLSAGIQASIAAGNATRDACLDSPGSTTEAVTVGATNATDGRAAFSNYGNCVDVFAPGNAITSADAAGSTTARLMSGTSSAAPHVAGVMALWLQQTPGLTPAQLHTLVVSNATPNAVSNALTPGAALLFALRDPALDPAPAPAPAPSAAPPAAPSNAALRLVALNRVDLSWTDNASDETSFQIERREGAGAWAPLATVGTNVTSYSDQSVVRDRSYTYRVRAASAAGTSAFSNEPSVTVTCTTRKGSLTCR
jgi:subtilisin family serine protease